MGTGQMLGMLLLQLRWRRTKRRCIGEWLWIERAIAAERSIIRIARRAGVTG